MINISKTPSIKKENKTPSINTKRNRWSIILITLIK